MARSKSSSRRSNRNNRKRNNRNNTDQRNQTQTDDQQLESLDNLHSLLLESLTTDDHQSEPSAEPIEPNCSDESNAVPEDEINDSSTLSSNVDLDLPAADLPTAEPYDVNEVFALAQEIGREFDSAGETLDELQTGNADQQSLINLIQAETSRINNQFAQFEDRFATALDRFEQRLEKMFHQMEQTIQDAPQINGTANRNFNETRPVPKPPSESGPKNAVGTDAKPVSGMSWESQKRKMLAEFGMLDGDFDEQETDQAFHPETESIEETRTETESIIVEKSGLDTIYDSIAKLESVAIDSEIIEQLKNELTGKLREAEVELSINRAKLSQEWANLDQMKSELSQREAALSSKYRQTKGNEKTGLLDRFTRHLSNKKS